MPRRLKRCCDLEFIVNRPKRDQALPHATGGTVNCNPYWFISH
jgi:hypothetical protein